MRRRRVSFLAAFLLISSGVVGILLSPSVGLHGGLELMSFIATEVHEYPWGTAISSSTIEVPRVENSRGLIFMHLFLIGSLASLFGGVHWYTVLKNQM